jgi:death-on-curing protein
MAFVRSKEIKGKTYYYLVENVRKGEKTYQKVIKYLGSDRGYSTDLKYVTPKDVIRTHDRIIEEFGGTGGVINAGAIDFITDSMLSRFNKEPLEESIIKKASLLLFELISQHPFIDGNKRIGFAVCEEFLNANGYSLQFMTEEAERLAFDIGKGAASKSSVEKWIKRHAERIRPSA